MITGSSQAQKLYASYKEFVQEVYATRSEVVAWDKVATKTDSFIGNSIPGFYASYEAIMNQYDFLIGCIEGKRTMDEALNELIRGSWEATNKGFVEDGFDGHPFYMLFTEVMKEAISTNMLFGDMGRRREGDISSSTEALKVKYDSMEISPKEDDFIETILLQLDPFIDGFYIDKLRYKSIRSKQIFNFPSRYWDALDNNASLRERMKNISKYIFSHESIGTPVCLFYEHLDDYGRHVNEGG